MAMQKDWDEYRKRIKGIQDAIIEGKTEDEMPESLLVEKIAQENPKKPKPYRLPRHSN